MPTYEYACAACDTRQEVQQKMTDPSLTVCPKCGASGLRKLFTNVGVVFKGAGFYRNDSRDTGKAGGSSDSTAATGSSTGADSTTTSTPAAAPAKTDAAPAKPSTPTTSTPATTAS